MFLIVALATGGCNTTADRNETEDVPEVETVTLTHTKAPTNYPAHQYSYTHQH
jgi:hypothetical protein